MVNLCSWEAVFVIKWGSVNEDQGLIMEGLNDHINVDSIMGGGG